MTRVYSPTWGACYVLPFLGVDLWRRTLRRELHDLLAVLLLLLSFRSFLVRLLLPGNGEDMFFRILCLLGLRFRDDAGEAFLGTCGAWELVGAIENTTFKSEMPTC